MSSMAYKINHVLPYKLNGVINWQNPAWLTWCVSTVAVCGTEISHLWSLIWNNITSGGNDYGINNTGLLVIMNKWKYQTMSGRFVKKDEAYKYLSNALVDLKCESISSSQSTFNIHEKQLKWLAEKMDEKVTILFQKTVVRPSKCHKCVLVCASHVANYHLD